VDAHPRVEEEAVRAPPLRVALDRDERVALLPARAHRRDQRAETVAARDPEHRLERGRAEPTPLEAARDHDHERAEDVRAALVEAAGDGAVDAGGETLDRAVPAHGDRAGPRENLAAVADEVELEVGPLVVQPPPVAVEDVAVVVVLGQDVACELPGGIGEIGALADGEGLHAVSLAQSGSSGITSPVSRPSRTARVTAVEPNRSWTVSSATSSAPPA
jgi:hypothetical protein